VAHVRDKQSPRGPARRLVLWEGLRTSFWFVPGLMGVAAMALSWVAHKGDEWVSRLPTSSLYPVVYVSTADNARDVMSTLLASMMTMTSLVFSITMVVLTLAASQFGPRLIRNFMASPHTQAVLGTFVMTTVYCLLVLGVIGSRSAEREQAFISVSTAIGLVLLSLALLVFFLHFLARSIVSESVIERLGKEVGALWDALEPVPKERNQHPDAQLPEDYESGATLFGPTQDGYVEAIEFVELVRLAESVDVLIALSFAPGDYVVRGGIGIGVYPASRCSKELKLAIQRTITIGSQRTPTQDPEFSIRHLVEIGVRALSPGVNDPYTAAAVINQLSASLCQLMGRALPTGQLHDEAGNLRVVCPRPTYATLIGAAFNQLRQNADSTPLVYIHLLDALRRVAESAQLQVQKEALREQVLVVRHAARRSIDDEHDLRTIEARAAAALEKLGGFEEE
jgi:uncharacterized membrane protein